MIGRKKYLTSVQFSILKKYSRPDHTRTPHSHTHTHPAVLWTPGQMGDLERSSEERSSIEGKVNSHHFGLDSMAWKLAVGKERLSGEG